MIDFRLYLVTNRKLSTRGGRSLEEVVKEACAAGVRAVQLREKDLSGRELYELAKRLRAISKQSNAKLFINDRVDIVLAAEADGVHCPEQGMPVATTRKLLPKNHIGVSVHSVESALAVEQDGADFITFGPVFSTSLKAEYGSPQGLDALAEVTACVNIPVFAIGGITPDRARECLKRGAHGVAVVSAVMSARDIGKAVGDFKNMLGEL